MQNGFPAPARRVSLFLMDNTAKLLTSSGVKLFDAAINWAAQCNGAQLHHDVLGDRSPGVLENETLLSEVPKEIAVYPNPAKDRIYVNLSSFEGEEVLIRLFDANGVLQQQWNVNAGKEISELQLNHEAPGYYLLWLLPSGSAQPLVKKLILEGR